MVLHPSSYCLLIIDDHAKPLACLMPA